MEGAWGHRHEDADRDMWADNPDEPGSLREYKAKHRLKHPLRF